MEEEKTKEDVEEEERLLRHAEEVLVLCPTHQLPPPPILLLTCALCISADQDPVADEQHGRHCSGGGGRGFTYWLHLLVVHSPYCGCLCVCVRAG